MEWKDRRVLVTGAGKGIGRATAVLLAERGAQVVALSRDQRDLDLLAAEVGCETICTDLAELDGIEASVADALPIDHSRHWTGGHNKTAGFDASKSRSIKHLIRLREASPVQIPSGPSVSCEDNLLAALATARDLTATWLCFLSGIKRG